MSRTDELRASPPMFASPALDRLTRVHPAVVALLYGPVVVLLAVAAAERLAVTALMGWIAAGYAFWTLVEYWLHRTVFHFEPESPTGRRLHWMLHGVHHDHPNDPLRLVMPPTASAPLAVAFCLAFWGVLGADVAPAFAAGFLGGYLVYDLLHFHLHHHRPRTVWERRLRELHMRHHFEDDDTGFGVSAPWWDVVFGTRPRLGRDRHD